ncbi:MAG: ABC transporter substrate-binding protein [Xanthobacteraceae bacterium]|nr:ABC transporter substrate-binding protein [Xanthobacteraceae bacterium]
MRNLDKILRSAAVALVCAGAAFASHNAAAQELKPIKALIPIPNFDESFSPVAVAQYLGYFKEEGLEVQILPVRGSNEVAIQVSAGNADVGLASPADAIIGMQDGKDLDVQYFHNLYYQNIWPISVPANSPVKKVSDLKGKKIGVLSMGSTGISFGRAYARDAGLDPTKDVTFIPIGVGAQALTAIRQQVVDGLVFNDAALAKFGVLGLQTRILPVSEKLRDLPDTSILAQRETLKTRQKELIGFARAIAKGHLFAIQNPTAAVKITWKLYPAAEPKNMPPAEALKQGVAVANARLAIWSSPKTKGVAGAFVEQDWNNLVAFLQEQGLLKQKIPTSRIYTTALLPEINEFDRDKVKKQAAEFKIESIK